MGGSRSPYPRPEKKTEKVKLALQKETPETAEELTVALSATPAKVNPLDLFVLLFDGVNPKAVPIPVVKPHPLPLPKPYQIKKSLIFHLGQVGDPEATHISP